MKFYQKHRNRTFAPGIHLSYALVLKTAPWYVKLIKIRGFFVASTSYSYWFGFND